MPWNRSNVTKSLRVHHQNVARCWALRFGNRKFPLDTLSSRRSHPKHCLHRTTSVHMIRIVLFVEEAWTERRPFLLHQNRSSLSAHSCSEDQQSLARRGIVKLSKQNVEDRLKIVAVHMYRDQMNEVNRHECLVPVRCFDTCSTLAFTARSRSFKTAYTLSSSMQSIKLSRLISRWEFGIYIAIYNLKNYEPSHKVIECEYIHLKFHGGLSKVNCDCPLCNRWHSSCT